MPQLSGINVMVKILPEIELSSGISNLKSELVAKRDRGEVLFEIKKLVVEEALTDSTAWNTAIDLFITQLGYSGLGDRWREISQTEAQNILIFIMTKDLAYSGQLMSREEAEQIAAKFLTFFINDCKFFTNAVFTNNYSGISAWDSITKATFDMGVVVMSYQRIGMLWVKDED